ncbi:unnamed protein product [Spodoptera exigua]|nr:unnamed protein product [Spodoptera exigua]
MNFLKNKPRARRNSASIMVSTERWRHYSRKMSRRGQELFDYDVDDYEPTQHNKENKNWVEELFERKSDAEEIEQDIEIRLTKKQTLILSTLVPDEILLMDKFNTVDAKRFVGVLLMADVSGYTALSERYNNTGKGGTYRLTATLNTYLGSLIELIYGHGGDIIKFAALEIKRIERTEIEEWGDEELQFPEPALLHPQALDGNDQDTLDKLIENDAKEDIEEAIDILQFALRTGQDHMTYESENWYHALCIDLILDAGFQLESPQDISRFAEYSICRGKSAGPSRRRLVVGLWTYWLRADSDRRAKRFENEALSWASHEEDSSLVNLFSALRLAEGMLESLARKVNDLRKVVDLMELRSVADRELARLENDARLLRAAFPRWCLLKANSSMLSGRNVAANTLYNQALDEAIKINNRLDEGMVRAAKSNSLLWIQNARTGQFVHWREGVTIARSSWHQIMYRMSTTRQ